MGLDEKQSAQLELSVLKELEKKREHVFRLDERKRAEQEATDSKKEKPRTGHGPRPQRQLPLVELAVMELSEENRGCKVFGGRVVEMKGPFEESEWVTVIHRQFRRERIRQQKYRCSCNANVVTAGGPEKLIAGGRYTVEFAAEVAVGKYTDHLPLERQVRMMAREGLEVDSQTLWDQVHALALHVKPTYNALLARALSAPVLHADESGWPLLGKKGKSPGSVWNLSTPEVIVCRMMPSKSEKDGREVLGNYRGTVVADGYVVYDNLKRAGPFRLANCWAHVLRHAEEAFENFPTACGELLKMIRELYDIEQEVPGGFPGTSRSTSVRSRHRSVPGLGPPVPGMSTTTSSIYYVYKEQTLDSPPIPQPDPALPIKPQQVVAGVLVTVTTSSESANLIGSTGTDRDPEGHLRKTLSSRATPRNVLYRLSQREQAPTFN